LVRITRGAAGIVVDGPSAGRGAWLCRTPDGVSAACFDEALRRRAFARAWRCEVGAHELAVVRMATIEGTHDGAEPAPSA